MAKNRDLSKFPNAITVLDNGNVGIGITPPTTTSFVHLFVGRNFSLFSGSSNDIYFGSNFYYSSGFKARYAEPSIMISSANGDIIFQNSSSGTADASLSVTEKVRITSSGSFGIGTSSPVSVFQVVSAGQGVAGFSGSTYGIRIDNGGQYSTGMSTIHGTDNTLYGSYQPLRINGSDLRFSTADTERVRIYSGNVVIGSTTSAGYGNVNLDLNAGSLPAAYFVIRTASNSVTAEYAIDSGAAYLSTKTAHPLRIRTSDVTRMEISSGGIVTRPYQPSFQANRTSGANQTISGTDSVGTVIVFDGTQYNIGGYYNSANGRFTAPVTGRYQFSSTCRFDGSTASTYIRLFFTINGGTGSTSYAFGHVIAGPGGYSTNYHSLTVAATLSLNSGDYVETRAIIATGSTGIQYESQFSGFLI